MAVELNNCKQKIFEYVESRMAFIAPNLSIIVGASTAAKIMGTLIFNRNIQSVKMIKLKFKNRFSFRCRRRFNKTFENAFVQRSSPWISKNDTFRFLASCCSATHRFHLLLRHCSRHATCKLKFFLSNPKIRVFL